MSFLTWTNFSFSWDAALDLLKNVKRRYGLTTAGNRRVIAFDFLYTFIVCLIYKSCKPKKTPINEANKPLSFLHVCNCSNRRVESERKQPQLAMPLINKRTCRDVFEMNFKVKAWWIKSGFFSCWPITIQNPNQS